MGLFDDLTNKPAGREPRTRGGLFADLVSPVDATDPNQAIYEVDDSPVTTPLGQRLWRRPLDVAIQAQQPVTQGAEGAIRAANAPSPYDDMVSTFPGEAQVRGGRFRLGQTAAGLGQGVGRMVDFVGGMMPGAGEDSPFDALLPGGNPITALGRQIEGGGQALGRSVMEAAFEDDRAGRINLEEFDPTAPRSQYMDAVADRIRHINEQAQASLTPEARRFQEGLGQAIPQGARSTIDYIVENPGHIADLAASLVGSLAVGGAGARLTQILGGDQRAQMLYGMIGGNALLAASNAGMDTAEQIRRLPIEAFADDQLFQQYVEAGMSPEDAREMIAKMGADISMMGAAFGTAGAMYFGDRMGLNVLERTVLGRFPSTQAALAATRLGQAGLATARQTGQETIQGFSTETGTAAGRIVGHAQEPGPALLGATGAAVLEAVSSAPTTAITAAAQAPQPQQLDPAAEREAMLEQERQNSLDQLFETIQQVEQTEQQDDRIQAALGQIMADLAAQQQGLTEAEQQPTMADAGRPGISSTRDGQPGDPQALVPAGPATATMGEMSPELAALSATLGQQVAPTPQPAQQPAEQPAQQPAARAPESPQETRTPEPVQPQRAEQDLAEADGPVRLSASQAVSEGTRRMVNAMNRVMQGVRNPPRGGVTVAQTMADLPEQYRGRLGDRTEGFYDPETDSVYLIADNIANPARGRWVAFHEMGGHVGIRRAAEAQGLDLGRVLDRMEQNPTVKSLADALQKDRPRLQGKRQQAVEEALAELQAARRTGDYQALNDRYRRSGFAGVRDPNSVRGLLDRLIDRIKGFLGQGVTDAEVAQLLEDAWSQVRDPGRPQQRAQRADRRVAESETEKTEEQLNRERLERVNRRVEEMNRRERERREAEARGEREPVTAQALMGALARERRLGRFGNRLPPKGTMEGRSEEFKRWFGNSHIVDQETGEPVVLYHGTTQSFDEFRQNAAPRRDDGFAGDGFYFTGINYMADSYAGTYRREGLPEGANVMPVYLSIQNPLDLGGISPNRQDDLVEAIEGAIGREEFQKISGHQSASELNEALYQEFVESDTRTEEQKLENILNEDNEVGVHAQNSPLMRDFRNNLVPALRRLGYDGIITRKWSGKGSSHFDEVVAFRPNQIKSAVGNRGTFDPESPSILESEAGIAMVDEMMRQGEEFAQRNNLPPPARVLPDGHPLLEPKFDDDSAERKALRQRLIDQRFEGAQPGERVAVVMGGGGASGKGTVKGMLARNGLLPQSAVDLDPDAFKTGAKNHNTGREMDGIPEYSQIAAEGDGRSALVTHEESSMLYKDALARAIEGGFPVILDRTLGGGDKSIRELQALKDAGYKINLVGVTIPAQEAMSRAVQRAKGPEKRYVPLQALAQAHAGFSRHFEDLAAIADEVALYDNNVPKGEQPILIAAKEEGQELELTGESAYNEFRRKADEQIAESEAPEQVGAATRQREGGRRGAGEGAGRAGQAERREGADRVPAQRLTVKPLERGAILVEGDPDEIRGRLPEGIKGRIVEGGIRFTATDAARVRQALEGRSMTYGRAGQVLAEKPMRDGKYVGAPPKFNTPSTIRTLRKRLRQYVSEGVRGRFWYEDSGKAILDYVQGDVVEARKLVALMSIYSPQARVISNATMGLKAWQQYKAGLPIKAKTGAQDAKAQRAMEDIDAFWSGEKTGNFFVNLLRSIDPSLADQQGATIDLWMMRAAEYDGDATTAAQYAFMEDEVNRIAREKGWEPQQVQASIWVAMLARMDNKSVKAATEESSQKQGWMRRERNKQGKLVRVIVDEKNHRANWLRHARRHKLTEKDLTQAAFHYGDGLQRHVGQLALEARPSRDAPVLPGIHDAPFEQQVNFQREMFNALLDENGVDQLAVQLGLLRGDATMLPGAWQGDISPAHMVELVVSNAAGKPTVSAEAERALNSYAAVVGYLFKQDMVGWHKPFFATTKRDANGLDIDLGRAITPEETANLERAVDTWMNENGHTDWAEGFAIISTPAGVRLINFGSISNAELQGPIIEAAQAVLPDAEVVGFRSEGDKVTNDWRSDTDGQAYLERARAEGSSDVFEWARDVLEPKVEAVRAKYEERWGGQSRADRRGAGEREGGSEEGGAEVRGQLLASESAEEAARPQQVGGPSTPTFTGRPAQPESLEVVGVHYSRAGGLSELDPAMYGRGARGVEARRVTGTPLARRTYFYEQTDNSDIPQAERVVGSAARNRYRVRLGNIYDGSADPLGIARAIREENGSNDANLFEQEVVTRGFDGYRIDGDLVGHSHNFIVVIDPPFSIPVEAYDEGGLLESEAPDSFLRSESPLEKPDSRSPDPMVFPWWQVTDATYEPESAMMNRFFKDGMAGYKRTFESASDRLRQIPGMQMVGEMVDRYFDREQRNTGVFNKHMLKPVMELHKMGRNPARFNEAKQVRRDFERWAEAFDQRGDHESIYESTTDLGRRLIDAWKATADETGQMNRRIGVQVYDPKIGKHRLIGKVKQFYPRRLKQWAQDAIAAPTRNPKDWARLVEILLDEGVIAKPEDAERYIKTMGAKDAAQQNDYFSGLEKARSDNWPAQLYDYRLETAIDYGPRWAERLAQIETFGQDGTELGEAWDVLLTRTRDPKLRKYLRRIHKQVVNRIEEGDEMKWLATLNSLATGLQLGNPMTATQNLITGSGLNYVAYGKYAAKGQLEAIVNSAPLLQDAVEAGIIRDDVMRIQRDLHDAVDEQGAINQAVSWLTSKQMTIGLYNLTERQIRLQAYAAARMIVRDLVLHAGKDPTTRRSLKLIAILQRNGFDYTKVLAEGGEGEYTDRVLRYLVNLPQGSYRINMVPVLVDSQLGRFTFKYRKYGTQVTRMAYMNHLKPAWEAVTKGGEKILVTDPVTGEQTEKRLVDFMQILRMIALPPIYGTANRYVRWALFGAAWALAGPDLEDLKKAMEDEDKYRAILLALSMALESTISSGVLAGGVSDMIQLNRDFADRRYIKNPLEPPAFGPPQAFVDFIRRTINEQKVTMESIDMMLTQTFSAYRAYGRAAARLTSGIELFDRSKLEMHRREISWVRKATREFAKSEDYDDVIRPSGRPGGFATNPNTAVSRKLHRAIVLDRPEEARAILAEHLASIEDGRERANARNSMISYVRNRQPIVVGSTYAHDRRALFLRWARENYTEAKYKRILEADRRYRQTAHNAIGMPLRDDEEDQRALERRADQRGRSSPEEIEADLKRWGLR